MPRRLGGGSLSVRFVMAIAEGGCGVGDVRDGDGDGDGDGGRGGGWGWGKGRGMCFEDTRDCATYVVAQFPHIADDEKLKRQSEDT